MSIDDSELVRQMLTKDPNDYYSILDVSPKATDEQIKRAYKKLAFAFHPDKNTTPGADDAFKIVGRAFSVVGDVEKRKTYDIHGPNTFSPCSTTGTHTYGPVDPNEIFRAFFGEFAMANDSPFNRYSSFQYMPIRRRRDNSAFFRTNEEPITPRQIIAQLLPLFVVLFLSFLNGWLMS